MNMTNFNKITLDLGWTIPYENVGLYYKYIDSDKIKAVIDIGNYSSMDSVDTDFVNNTLEKHFNKNIFKKENINWCLPLLASDYFAHKADFDNELFWAKKAINENNKLTPLQFSSAIRPFLEEYEQ